MNMSLMNKKLKLLVLIVCIVPSLKGQLIQGPYGPQYTIAKELIKQNKGLVLSVILPKHNRINVLMPATHWSQIPVPHITINYYQQPQQYVNRVPIQYDYMLPLPHMPVP